jgi:hypothetical protein
MVTFVLRRAAIVVLPLAVLLVSAGCSSDSSSSTTPTAPSTNPTTEMFSGTVPVGGSDFHNFTVALSNGQVNIILTQAGPPATIYEGLAIGTPSGTTPPTCSILTGGSTQAQASTVAQLTGTANAGTYCVLVYDIGNQAQDITYSVTVSHY